MSSSRERGESVSETTLTLPALPSTPLGAIKEPPRMRLVASDVPDEVKENTRQAGYAGYSAELHSALTDKLKAEAAAATPPPLEPEKFMTDRWAFDAVGEIGQQRSVAQLKAAALDDEASKERRRRSLVPAPFGWLARCGISLACLCITAVCIVAITYQMHSTVDFYLVRPYFDTDGESTSTSQMLAVRQSLSAVAALLLSQTVLVLLTWGRLHVLLKVGFFVADLGFSLMFGLLRMGEVFSYQALTPSGWEFWILFGHTLFLIGVAWKLLPDADKAAPYALVLMGVKKCSFLVKGAGGKQKGE